MADLKKIAAGLGIIAAVATFTTPFEGLRTKAYPDPANPRIATICMGETEGIHFGDTKTPAECQEMLEKSLQRYMQSVDKQLPGLPDNRRIAYADAAYNLGTGILARRSTRKTDEGKWVYIADTSIVELERAGRWQDGCRRLLVFNTANGTPLPGLSRRRAAETSLCLEDWTIK